MKTTVVGSYPRIGDARDEQKLRRALARFDRGAITQEELRAVEDEVVREVVAEQVAAGIDLVADGLVRWYDAQSHFAKHLRGFEVDGLVRYFDTNTYYRQPVAVAPVRWTAPFLVPDWRAAQDASDRPVKAILTGPYTLAVLSRNKAYPSVRDLVLDLADAEAQEVRALVEAGVRHIQVNEPAITRDPDDVGLVEDGIEILARRKGPAELHLFTFFGDVAQAFESLESFPVDVIGLDLVQGFRTWEVLRRAGSDRRLALGLIDARNTKLEDPRAIAAKVSELASVVDLNGCYLSPSNGLEFLPRDRAREKLRVVVEAARLVGGSS